MSRHKTASRAFGHTARRAIASQAARLMAEDGISDYGFAKRKAARNLGFGDHEALPTNDEVETELRLYQSLYQDEEHQTRLHHLREIALDVMALMEDFRPYLTGAVLDGTAGRFSGVDLDLFADSAKDVEIYLLSRNIPYESSEPRRPAMDVPETQLHIEWAGEPVQLSVYPLTLERMPKKSGAGLHSRFGRARADAVRALLESPAATES